MAENIRLIHKHGTETELGGYIPALGEAVICDPDDTYAYPRVKMGDGQKTVSELPFISYGTQEPGSLAEGALFFVYED